MITLGVMADINGAQSAVDGIIGSGKLLVPFFINKKILLSIKMRLFSSGIKAAICYCIDI